MNRSNIAYKGILLIFFLCFQQIVSAEQNSRERMCISPDGHKVDWYVVFLFPRAVDPDEEINFGYYDSSMSKIKYYRYSEDIFPPTKITQMIIDDESSINYFFWNDDMTVVDDPEKRPAPRDRAHAKGTLAIDSSNAVFLLHSLPRFPARTDSNKVLTILPSNAGYYAQHFLCVSTSARTGNEIARLLNYINVSNNKSVKEDQVNIPANVWIERLIENKYDYTYPLEEINTIKSLDGKEFTIISKSHLNKIVPYLTTLREIFKDDFYIRTWVRPYLYPKQCDDYQLLNVIDVNFDDKYQFSNKLEHSKWAVSKKKNICCFADLNYVESQKNRGGNIVCFEDESLAKIMRGVIETHDICFYRNNFFSWLYSKFNMS